MVAYPLSMSDALICGTPTVSVEVPVLSIVALETTVVVEVAIFVCEPLPPARYPTPKLATTRIAMTAAVAPFFPRWLPQDSNVAVAIEPDRAVLNEPEERGFTVF